MGCTASKLDNEDTVRRCKERRRLMKEAVYARHHLASAHSDYLRSLRLTGSALADFAAGEPLSVAEQTPSILLRHPSISSYRPPPPPPPPLRAPPPQSPQPPPPPPPFSPSSSPTIASSKLPHILSESSPSSTPRQKPAAKYNYPFNFPANSTYCSTPSQASSVWNWENFYPPSPPGSDFFRRPKDEDQHSDHNHDNQSDHDHSHHHLDHDENDDDDERTDREEVHCSEWGDHYSSSSSDTKSENDNEGDRDTRSEIGSRSNFGSSVHKEATVKSNYAPMGKSEKSDDAGSSVSWNAGTGEIQDMRLVVKHRNLAEIVAAIKEYFEKAATAGEQVSELLETGRAQLDRSFKQLKKTVYHSSSLLSNLSSTWTSKPPLAIKYRLDAGSLDESGGPKSHCSTMERLLAWEKKLYEEVKAHVHVEIHEPIP
uniref:Uncharacterized protein n=1 Tax=Nelumbo nucifera TaxID=4432 RepID=A0A822XLH7_NELNU|nr:TPA_asm: hypothetical protein HUJ06_019851 [Nelumbo nucifera]